MPGQVRHHRESTERQYALREKALEVGRSESLIRTPMGTWDVFGRYQYRREINPECGIHKRIHTVPAGLARRPERAPRGLHHFGRVLEETGAAGEEPHPRRGGYWPAPRARAWFCSKGYCCAATVV